MWRASTVSQTEGIPESTFVEGESVFCDRQDIESQLDAPFSLEAVIVLCILLGSVCLRVHWQLC